MLFLAVRLLQKHPRYVFRVIEKRCLDYGYFHRAISSDRCSSANDICQISIRDRWYSKPDLRTISDGCDVLTRIQECLSQDSQRISSRRTGDKLHGNSLIRRVVYPVIVSHSFTPSSAGNCWLLHTLLTYVRSAQSSFRHWSWTSGVILICICSWIPPAHGKGLVHLASAPYSRWRTQGAWKSSILACINPC